MAPRERVSRFICTLLRSLTFTAHFRGETKFAVWTEGDDNRCFLGYYRFNLDSAWRSGPIAAQFRVHCKAEVVGSCWQSGEHRRLPGKLTRLSLRFWWLVIVEETQKASGMYQRWSRHFRPMCFGGNRFHKRGHVCATNPEVSFLVTSVHLLLLQWAENERCVAPLMAMLVVLIFALTL